MRREGILFVISAPSGAGKTTLCKEIIDIFPNLRHSISFTTRQARPGETDGRDYHFITHAEFMRMVAAAEFAEWAEVHGNLYGTSLKTLEDYRKSGIDVILDIDCQGAQQLKKRFQGAVYLFILPPSVQELRRRLDFRCADAPDVIERRLAAAAGEIRESRWYDYIIVNDVFSKAVGELKSIVMAEQCRTPRILAGLSQLYEI